MSASPATPELTFREAAHFAAVGLGAVEKAVEARVLPVAKPGRRTSGGAGVRRLPLASVAYLAAVREAGLTDLALKHKRAIWGGLAGCPSAGGGGGRSTARGVRARHLDRRGAAWRARRWSGRRATPARGTPTSSATPRSRGAPRWSGARA